MPLRWQQPKRIFVNSMSDVFHEDVPDTWIDQILPSCWRRRCVSRVRYFSDFDQASCADVCLLCWDAVATDRCHSQGALGANLAQAGYGPPRVSGWACPSKTNPPLIRAFPGCSRCPRSCGFSAISALGPLDLYRGGWNWLERLKSPQGRRTERLDWVIVGGESGPQRRRMALAWLTSLVGTVSGVGTPSMSNRIPPSGLGSKAVSLMTCGR